MRRGDFVTIALQGDFGKPRPALIIQTDTFNEHPTVTLLPLTTTIVDALLFRVTVTNSEKNGLTQTSQIMIDKAVTVQREKIGKTFGHIDSDIMINVERSLALFLGIAE